MIELCPTQLRAREFGRKDLWCQKHQMWVYERLGSWIPNERHETAKEAVSQ